jgi:YidC/Oxa1 family membrane protein insertase
MPIIFGLFVLLRNPMIFISNPDMMLAVHEAFLWISDLSQPDAWILPLGAGITTYISFAQTQSQTAVDPNNPMSSMTNIMKYFFPVMIVWMGRSFPAGLALYWFIGTLMQILFNIRLNILRKRFKEKQ